MNTANPISDRHNTPPSDITPQEYRARRQRLLERLEDDSLVVLPTASVQPRSADMYYPFQPDRNFYYLTGFDEPQAVAILIKTQGKTQYILFNRAKDPEQERWVGSFAGQEAAVARYGADEAYPIAELEKRLPKLLTGKKHLYYPWQAQTHYDQCLGHHVRDLARLGRRGICAPTRIYNIEPLVHEMRLIKSPAEIEIMTYAARVSAQAHVAAIRACRPGVFEYELQAEFSYVLQRHGCRQYAYDPIIAGGERACILHYDANDRRIEDGELMLADVGGEYRYYAADITRTVPVNGCFSAAQKKTYDIVLTAQTAGMAMLKPGKMYRNFTETVAATITDGLLDAGLLHGKRNDLIAKKAWQTYYPHAPGHWLGLDTHDVGSYVDEQSAATTERRLNRLFEPGMMLTNEPGVYIPRDDAQADKPWRGIGVRIEDNVLITADGPRVLTDDAPKDIDAVETLMQQQ